MIRLKVFISSMQKELGAERAAVGSFLATDDFLRECTVPRAFEKYPQPLRPNPKGYLDLLRECQVYLLIIDREYGIDAGDGISATHEEYRLAQELGLPTLVCIKGSRSRERDEATTAFLKEIEKDNHTYSRFEDEAGLLKVVGERLREHIEVTYATVPRRAQREQSELTLQSASSFERETLSALAYDDLDDEVALDIIAAAEDRDRDRIPAVELPRLLLSRGYLWNDDEVYRPTVAGALLLARSPGTALPQARVQMDAYAGTGRDGEPVDSVFIDAPLARTVEQAVAFIRRNTPNPLKVEGLRREDASTYPTEVLREVIVNAVAHRDYADLGVKIVVEVFADRLVVSNPGLPPGGQSVQHLASGDARSRSRNPLVVQGLSWLELMDDRGSGIRRMTRLLEQAGHPKPAFRVDRGSLVVELRPSAGASKAVSTDPEAVVTEDGDGELTPRDVILQELRESGEITTRRCVQRLGISRASAYRILNELCEAGLLEKQGGGRSTKYTLSGNPN